MTSTAHTGHKLPRSQPQRRNSRGFSLIELVSVIIVVGILAAIAVPKDIATQREARIAAVQSMVGTLWSAASTLHLACATSSNCNINSYFQGATIGGHFADLIWAYPNAGDNLGNGQIDDWIIYTGFTASLPTGQQTKFSLDGAPDPSSCSATYQEPSTTPTPSLPLITSITTGC